MVHLILSELLCGTRLSVGRASLEPGRRLPFSLQPAAWLEVIVEHACMDTRVACGIFCVHACIEFTVQKRYLSLAVQTLKAVV